MHPRLTFFFFFFNDTATTEIYTLSLHDALPISFEPRGKPDAADQTVDDEQRGVAEHQGKVVGRGGGVDSGEPPDETQQSDPRSEEHTSELQSPCNLVCRLLLEKKKQANVHLDPA